VSKAAFDAETRSSLRKEKGRRGRTPHDKRKVPVILGKRVAEKRKKKGKIGLLLQHLKKKERALREKGGGKKWKRELPKKIVSPRARGEEQAILLLKRRERKKEKRNSKKKKP